MDLPPVPLDGRRVCGACVYFIRPRWVTDRYHAHSLRSPTETANAIAYVLGNTHVHAVRRGRPIRPDAIDPLTSAANRELVAQPHTWLLRIGWTLGLPGG
jgi:hypothetical protein